MFYELGAKKSQQNVVDLSELQPSIEELVAKEARKLNMFSRNNEPKTSQTCFNSQEKSYEERKKLNLEIGKNIDILYNFRTVLTFYF